ncbi:MAG: hypothetical protein JRE40_15160 [Deltaproteobacteria bacterium]|nr:hypothetical protein [Deltaproteobacteria bacterium]
MKKIIGILAVFFFVASLSVVTISNAEVLKFKLTGHMPVGHICTVAAEKFVKEVEKRSNGNIQITYYPAGQLARDVKALQMVQKGGIQMAQFFTNRGVGIVPEVQLTVPYFDDVDWFMRRLFDPQSGGGLCQKLLAPGF